MAAAATGPGCPDADHNNNNKEEMDFGMGTVPQLGDPGCINDMQVCMYDESHVVAGGKYHGHVENCRQHNHGVSATENAGLHFCPYNLSHHIQAKYMPMHIELCDGYYKYTKDSQQDPLSMQVTYERYKTKKIPDKSEGGNNPDGFDVDNWEISDDEDDDMSIRGVTIENAYGIVQTPATRGEFRRIQEALALQLAKEINDLPLPKEMNYLPPPKDEHMYSSFRKGDLAALAVSLPSTTHNEKMRRIAKYAEDAAEIIRNLDIEKTS